MSGGDLQNKKIFKLLNAPEFNKFLKLNDNEIETLLKETPTYAEKSIQKGEELGKIFMKIVGENDIKKLIPLKPDISRIANIILKFERIKGGGGANIDPNAVYNFCVLIGIAIACYLCYKGDITTLDLLDFIIEHWPT